MGCSTTIVSRKHNKLSNQTKLHTVNLEVNMSLNKLSN